MSAERLLLQVGGIYVSDQQCTFIYLGGGQWWNKVTDMLRTGDPHFHSTMRQLPLDCYDYVVSERGNIEEVTKG